MYISLAERHSWEWETAKGVADDNTLYIYIDFYKLNCAQPTIGNSQWLRCGGKW